MIVKNKKDRINVLAYKEGALHIRVPVKGNETLNIPKLLYFDQIINKQDFGSRGWFEIIKKEILNSTEEESALEKARKEVKEYTSKKELEIIN